MFTHDLAWLACVDADGFYQGQITQRGITHILGETYRRRSEEAGRDAARRPRFPAASTPRLPPPPRPPRAGAGATAESAL